MRARAGGGDTHRRTGIGTADIVLGQALAGLIESMVSLEQFRAVDATPHSNHGGASRVLVHPVVEVVVAAVDPPQVPRHLGRQLVRPRTVLFALLHRDGHDVAGRRSAVQRHRHDFQLGLGGRRGGGRRHGGCGGGSSNGRRGGAGGARSVERRGERRWQTANNGCGEAQKLVANSTTKFSPPRRSLVPASRIFTALESPANHRRTANRRIMGE